MAQKFYVNFEDPRVAAAGAHTIVVRVACDATVSDVQQQWAAKYDKARATELSCAVLDAFEVALATSTGKRLKPSRLISELSDVRS